MSLLGKKVKDMITGFEGIVIVETDWEYSQRRCGVQSQVLKSDGSLMETNYFDTEQLTVVDEPTPEVLKVLRNLKKPKYSLGSIARCGTTGFEGRIVAIDQWLFGCTRYQLQPTKLTKEGKVADRASVEEANTILVSTSTTVQPLKNPGGPQPNPVRPTDPVR